jgi:hypothetical protein
LKPKKKEKRNEVSFCGAYYFCHRSFARVLCGVLVLALAGCGTLNTLKPGISKSDIRARLDVIEQDYSAAKDKLVEYRAQGLIDDPTWAELVRLDQRFSDEWSMAIVELNAGEDWRETVLFVAGILSQLSAAGIDGGVAQGINAVAGLAVALTREKTMEEVR